MGIVFSVHCAMYTKQSLLFYLEIRLKGKTVHLMHSC